MKKSRKTSRDTSKTRDSKTRKFMQGRYGMDEFGRFLGLVSMICFLLSMLFGLILPNSYLFPLLIGVTLLVYVYFRTFSRNAAERTRENESYKRFMANMQAKRSTRREQSKAKKIAKEKVTVHCDNCGTNLNVPLGKGKIKVTCPKCKHTFILYT